MSKARDPMKSHFCMTIFQYEETSINETMQKDKVVDFTPIINKIIEVARMMRAHYLCWSIEDCSLEPSKKNDASKKEAAFVSEAKVGEKFGASVRSPSEENHSDGDPTENGGLHIHVYMECERTIRWSTVVNKWQKNGFEGTHVEVRTGWRTTCREYHMGLKNYQEKPSFIISGEWGKFREDLADSYSQEDYFELAAGMIMHGYSPSDVAKKFPKWYIRHGRGVIQLWESINRDFKYWQ